MMVAINLFTLAIMTLVFVAATVGIMYLLGYDVLSLIDEQIQEIFKSFIRSITGGSVSKYDVCEPYSGKKISLQEFQTLLMALYNEQCLGRTEVTASFSVTKSDINRISQIIGFPKKLDLIFYREAVPMGVGALIIEGNPGDYPIDENDRLELWQEGSPADILINVTAKGCDPYDGECDPACSYESEVCDPLCYVDGASEGVACDIDCVDVNGNGKIDAADFDSVCDPDCYDIDYDPNNAYDPDCVQRFKSSTDDICDPDSNGINDSICDPDCAGDNFICDPDCDGVTDTDNPMGLADSECYECDGTCNSYCSPACLQMDEDPDCPGGFSAGMVECCGNDVCGESESCENCEEDCPPDWTCQELDMFCCTIDPDADEYGCTLTGNSAEGEECYCDSQCAEDLYCTSNHCCPEDYAWDGEKCDYKYTFILLFIQLNNQISNFESKAESTKDKWVEITPLSECPDKVNAIAVTDRTCNVNECDYSGTIDALIECANSWGYGSLYTRIVGVVQGSYVCTPGILGFTMGYGYPSVSAESSIVTTTPHELGHTFGLCDEGYGNEPDPSCPSGWCGLCGSGCSCPPNSCTCCPNAPESNSIMCSTDSCNRGCSYAVQFTSTSYAHLQGELNKYC